MATQVHGATAAELEEVRALLRQSFRGPDFVPGPLAPFYVAYDICDPAFRPEQYRFRRLRGRVVSALKVFVRRLQHPNGPVPVTLIGGVCTRADLRGRGLIGPVLRDALAFSRALGAAAQLIVTPRKDYYGRHGYRPFPTVHHAGSVPPIAPAGRVELLQLGDEGWMTEMHNAPRFGYGPLLWDETYTRRWVLEMRLGDRSRIGLKLLRRGRPAAYLIADVKADPARVLEAAARGDGGGDEVALLGALRHLGRRRFTGQLPDAHPLLAALRARGARLRRTVEQRLLYHPLAPDFVPPGEEFCHSRLDDV